MPGSPAASPPEPGGGSGSGGGPATPALARLDAALIRLHGSGDAAALARLHEDAAAALAGPGARRFHLTHAWVFALEAGDEPRALRLESALRALGGL